MINVNKLLLKACNAQSGYIQGPIRGCEMIQYLKMQNYNQEETSLPLLGKHFSGMFLDEVQNQ